MDLGNTIILLSSLLFLIGLAWGLQVFLYKLKNSAGIGEWWKSLVVLIIWIMLYLILITQLSAFIFHTFAPPMNSTNITLP